MLALICFGGYCGGVTDLSALPASLREFIEATNAAEPLRFLAVFSDEAIIDDWGRKFVGHDEIASWDQTDNIGVRAQFELVDYAVLAGDHVLRLRVTSDRFNGVGTLRFTLGSDGLITALVIS
ncbi:nuclear transport factor 2 family protein [Plantibacter sp. Mn2098]|uniref:nuclear transport factor 2 family protein n=1 Tax=Plantibacter sp. Mn2098 TaxID=3395266 RepID=UPI003BC88D46